MRTAAARSEGAAPGSSEIVERPGPGLRRGQWEAPAYVFYAILILTALCLFGGVGWLGAAARKQRRGGPRP